MLSALTIKNIVLIDQIELELFNGLSVLTGETGAGKSILLDALSLALGGRGDASLVRKGQESGSVIAEFNILAEQQIFSLLRDMGISVEENLILKRIQYADGRTRAFINGEPVSASFLRKIGSHLVEIHGQHDDRALIDSSTHRQALDNFADLTDLANEVAQKYSLLKEIEAEIDEQKRKLDKFKQEEEYAKHVIQELSELNIKIGEEEELSNKRRYFMQLEKSTEQIKEIDEILHGINAPAPILASLMRKIARKSDEAELFAPIVKYLDSSLLELDKLSAEVEKLKNNIEFDINELEIIEERLFALREQARKHNVNCDKLPEILQKYKIELANFERDENKLANLMEKEKIAKNAYLEKALELSKGRKRGAEKLKKSLEKELPDLKLGAAKFHIVQQIDENLISKNGFDKISFEVQTNPDTNIGPLIKVASGGELSRFLLALKVVLAEKGSAPVLIFDEIDAGVGGAVADAIGRRLKRLANNMQLISITHAPQIAARAKNHFLIEKHSSNEGKENKITVKYLDDNMRREEVARMLAGAKISKEARAAAMRLLAEGE